jgi:NAD-dependent SIR2 family protein deacetylase
MIPTDPPIHADRPDRVPLAARAAEALRAAGALVITAGAGMGVDSGLPDFRGNEGFWKAYPPYERLGLSFVDAANPENFEGDPAFGWGFYGHRLNLYRATVPHRGFALLRGWASRLGLPAFVVTSNVDGQFQRAGFDPDTIVEVHGSIHHLQCLVPCTADVWDNAEEVPVHEATMRAERIPSCPRCGGVARPNILMFGDGGWIPDRTHAQRRRFDGWLAVQAGAERPLVVVELGAGTAIATIRWTSEGLGGRPGARVVRINPREAQIGAPHLSIAAGALEGLEAIDRALAQAGPPTPPVAP